MKADVTHYTLKEGGDWLEWPFKDASVKPSNPQLLTWVGNRDKYHWWHPPTGVVVTFHSLKLSDGAEWDAIKGFRKPEWNKAH